MRRTLFIGWLTLACLAAASAAMAADKPARAPKPKLEAWRRIAVYHDGRIMPLDSFANSAVELITGRANPTLELAGAVPADALRSEALGPARQLFPDGGPRKFTAAELLLSWLVEPEKWEDVPFIAAGNVDLREKYLELPAQNEAGLQLKYASPRQVREAAALQQRLQDLRQEQMRAEAEGQKFRTTGVDKKVQELFQAYALYRQLIFDPTLDPGARSRFDRALERLAPTWSRLAQQFGLFHQLGDKHDLAAAIKQLEAAGDKLNDLTSQRSFTLDEGQAAATLFSQAAGDVAKQFAGFHRTLRETAPAGFDEAQTKKFLAIFEQLEGDTRALSRDAKALQTALYDNRKPLRIVPALNAAALEKDRDPSDDSQPWLDLQTALEAPLDVLSDYPQAELSTLRLTFGKLAQAYRVHRQEPPVTLAVAQSDFAAAVRKLGEKIDPLRRDLPITARDEDMLRHTAFPPAGYTDKEVRYNSLDPFKWSWVISALSALCFAGVFVFGQTRSRAFWVGMAVLAAGLVWSAYGFYLRIAITHWAPVTNMYETVIYVPFFVTLMGAWLALLPLTWGGVQRAWQLTAVPGTWETRGEEFAERARAGDGMWNLLLLVPRTLLSFYLFAALAWWPFYSGGRTVVNLLPNVDVGRTLPDLNDTMTWAVGLVVLAATVWYLPRMATALLASAATVPAGLRGAAARKLAPQAYARWPFALAATFVAFLGSYIAWYSPVLNKDFAPLTPVLRDQFWLLVHVLTIVSSYGAGALAWGIGLIGLGYYLLGKYRPVVIDGATVTHRPPQACSVMSGYVYKAVQVAVLLLAAGTILGALWADVAWGRFWGWDPKEVWALISLLVYLAILHGRYAGWVGNFGLTAGTVAGATAIIMSWYGVNFVLGKGLHSYGFGEGETANWYVLGGVLANWLFVGAAWLRYAGKTRRDDEGGPDEGDDDVGSFREEETVGVA